jgi:hypothetical protein
MATIAILADIIIPADEVSGSATDAKVPDFIEFIVKDMPQHQVPLRGGLRWLDIQSMKRFGKPFKDADQKQQIEIVDDIAFPVVNDRENPERNMNAARGQWSRPAPELIRGVRPNSPDIKMIVSSSFPRASRSWIRAESPWSSDGNWLRM